MIYAKYRYLITETTNLSSSVPLCVLGSCLTCVHRERAAIQAFHLAQFIALAYLRVGDYTVHNVTRDGRKTTRVDRVFVARHIVEWRELKRMCDLKL